MHNANAFFMKGIGKYKMNLLQSLRALTKFERLLWVISLSVVTASYLLSRDFYLPSLLASLIGVTALIFVSKGDVLGQILTVVFSVLYAVVSLRFRYYGEMITYLGMTAPIAVISIVSWLRHPFRGQQNEVTVARLTARALWFGVAGAIGATILFYFILRAFHTANLWISTLSVTTSFLAAYLTVFRSPYYALAYAANDVVLIVLWILATVTSPAYLPIIFCFLMFLCNDLYGFYNWLRIQQRQQNVNSQSKFHSRKAVEFSMRNKWNLM